MGKKRTASEVVGSKGSSESSKSSISKPLVQRAISTFFKKQSAQPAPRSPRRRPGKISPPLSPAQVSDLKRAAMSRSAPIEISDDERPTKRAKIGGAPPSLLSPDSGSRSTTVTSGDLEISSPDLPKQAKKGKLESVPASSGMKVASTSSGDKAGQSSDALRSQKKTASSSSPRKKIASSLSPKKASTLKKPASSRSPSPFKKQPSPGKLRKWKNREARRSGGHSDDEETTFAPEASTSAGSRPAAAPPPAYRPFSTTPSPSASPSKQLSSVAKGKRRAIDISPPRFTPAPATPPARSSSAAASSSSSSSGAAKNQTGSSDSSNDGLVFPPSNRARPASSRSSAKDTGAEDETAGLGGSSAASSASPATSVDQGSSEKPPARSLKYRNRKSTAARDVEAKLSTLLDKAAAATKYLDEKTPTRLAARRRLADYWSQRSLDLDTVDFEEYDEGDFEKGFARSMAGYIVGIIEKHLSQTFSAHVNPRTAAFLCQPLATLIEILLEPYRLSPAAQRLHLALKEDPSTDPRPYLDELKRTDRGAWLYLISEGTSSYVGVAQCFSARMGTYDSELKEARKKAKNGKSRVRTVIKRILAAQKTKNPAKWFGLIPAVSVLVLDEQAWSLTDGLAAEAFGGWGKGSLSYERYADEMGDQASPRASGRPALAAANMVHPAAPEVLVNRTEQDLLETHAAEINALLGHGLRRVFSEVEDKKTDKLGRLVGNRYCRIWLPRTTAHVAAGASSTNVYFQKSTASSFGTDGLPVTVRVRISSTGRLEVVDPRNNRDLSDCLTNGATHLVRRWLECVAQYRSLRPLLEKTSLDLSAYETASPTSRLSGKAQLALEANVRQGPADGSTYAVDSSVILSVKYGTEKKRGRTVPRRFFQCHVRINHAGYERQHDKEEGSSKTKTASTNKTKTASTNKTKTASTSKKAKSAAASSSSLSQASLPTGEKPQARVKTRAEQVDEWLVGGGKNLSLCLERDSVIAMMREGSLPTDLEPDDLEARLAEFDKAEPASTYLTVRVAVGLDGWMWREGERIVKLEDVMRTDNSGPQNLADWTTAVQRLKDEFERDSATDT